MQRIFASLLVGLLVVVLPASAGAAILHATNFSHRALASYVESASDEDAVGTEHQTYGTDYLEISKVVPGLSYRCAKDLDAALGNEGFFGLRIESAARCSVADTACVVDSDCPAGESCAGEVMGEGEEDLVGFTRMGASSGKGAYVSVRRSGASLIGELRFLGLEPRAIDVTSFPIDPAGTKIVVHQKKINDSTMGVFVRVDGDKLNESNTPLTTGTCAGTACDIDTACVGTIDGTATKYGFRISDFVVATTDVELHEVYTLHATGNAETNWTTQNVGECTPGTRWGCVREWELNAETWCNESVGTECGGYVSRTTGTTTQRFDYGDLPAFGATEVVLAVRMTAAVFNNSTNATHAHFANVLRPVSTNYLGADVDLDEKVSGFITWKWAADIWDVSPETSVAWTRAEVNGTSFGGARGNPAVANGETCLVEQVVYVVTKQTPPPRDQLLPNFLRCVDPGGAKDQLPCSSDADCTPTGTCYEDDFVMCCGIGDSSIANTGIATCVDGAGDCGDRACTTNADCADLGGTTQGTEAYCDANGVCQVPCSLNAECSNCGANATCPLPRTLMSRFASDLSTCDGLVNYAFTGMDWPFLETAMHELYDDPETFENSTPCAFGCQRIKGPLGFCWPASPSTPCDTDTDCSGGDACYPYVCDHVVQSIFGNGAKANLAQDDCSFSRAPVAGGVMSCRTYTPTPGGPTPTPTPAGTPTPTVQECKKDTDCAVGAMCGGFFIEYAPVVSNQWQDRICPMAVTTAPGHWECASLRCDDKASDPRGRDAWCEGQYGAGSECARFCDNWGAGIVRPCTVTNVCEGTTTTCTTDAGCVGIGTERCVASFGGGFRTTCYESDDVPGLDCPPNPGATSSWWGQSCTRERCVPASEELRCTCPLGNFSCSGHRDCRRDKVSKPFMCEGGACTGNPTDERWGTFVSIAGGWDGVLYGHRHETVWEEYNTAFVDYVTARAGIPWWMQYAQSLVNFKFQRPAAWTTALYRYWDAFDEAHPYVFPLAHRARYEDDRLHHQVSLFNTIIHAWNCGVVAHPSEADCVHNSLFGVEVMIKHIKRQTENLYAVCTGDTTVPCSSYDVSCTVASDCDPDGGGPEPGVCGGDGFCSCVDDDDCPGTSTCETVDAGGTKRCVGDEFLGEAPAGDGDVAQRRVFRPRNKVCEDLGKGTCRAVAVAPMCTRTLDDCVDDDDCDGAATGDVCASWGHWIECNEARPGTPVKPTGTAPAMTCSKPAGSARAVFHYPP